MFGGIILNRETGELIRTKELRNVGIPKMQLPNFPEYSEIQARICFVTMNDGYVLSCGEGKTCYILRDGKWLKHSTIGQIIWSE